MSSSSSAILSDALSVLSKTTHQIIADVEARSRSEVARATADASEARHQLEKALKDLHAAQLEAEAARNQTIAAKAQYAQAELTIAHHLETLSQHVETIAQLRREVTQWKDTSKNWQDHFSRVEEERVALASRIDELQAERLLWTKNALTQAQNNIALTPRSPYPTDSPIQASTSKQTGQQTPHQSQSNGTGSRRASGAKPPRSESSKRVKPTSTVDSPLHVSSSKASQHSVGLPRITQPHSMQQASQEASERRKEARRKRKEEEDRQKELAAQQAQPAHQQPTPKSQSQPVVRQTTVLRRVQAVIRVKQEDSDEEPALPQTPPPPQGDSRGRSRTGQYQEQQQQSQPHTEPKARRRRTSRMIVQDDDDDESEEDNAIVARNLRASKAIDYAESEMDGESEEDELMIGNEENRDEVFGSSKSKGRAKPRTSNVGPPPKKRKVSSKPQR